MTFRMIARAGFAALCLTAVTLSWANAASLGRPETTHRQGGYDNTRNVPDGADFGYTGGAGA